MPRTACGGAQGVIGGQLYVYTGCVASSSTAVFFRYNPTTNTWTTRARPPVDHLAGAGESLDGKFHLVAGLKPCSTCGDPGITEGHAQLDVYNPATNTWTTKANLSSIRSSMAAAGLKGKLFEAGGSGEFEEATLEVYDPVANTWTKKAPLPNATADGVYAYTP